MALVAARSRSRNPSVRSPSAALSRGALPQGDALLEEVGRFVAKAAAAGMPALSARWSERLKALAAGATWESLAAAGDESVAMAIAGARVFEVDATG